MQRDRGARAPRAARRLFGLPWLGGFGATGHLHTARLLSLSEDLPVAIVIVDAPKYVDEFLPELDELVTGGLVILDDVEVIRYVGDPTGRAARSFG